MDEIRGDILTLAKENTEIMEIFYVCPVFPVASVAQEILK